MKARCKPGDLAIIVREEPGCEKNIGKVVEVSGPTRMSKTKGPQWIIRSASPRERWFYKRTSKGAEVFSRRGLRFEDEVDHPDAWMVPIIGKNGTARHRAAHVSKCNSQAHNEAESLSPLPETISSS